MADYTECVADLDQQSKIVIYESILTFFKLNVIFRGSWEVMYIG